MSCLPVRVCLWQRSPGRNALRSITLRFNEAGSEPEVSREGQTRGGYRQGHSTFPSVDLCADKQVLGKEVPT